jgi:hypothetical protein
MGWPGIEPVLPRREVGDYHKRRIIVPGKGFYRTETVSGAILEMHLDGNLKSLPVK